MAEAFTPADHAAAYAARLACEDRFYRDCEEVHRLPDIFHYWSDRYARPKLEAFGFSNAEDMFRKYLSDRCQAQGRRQYRFVSIGSGNCDMEIQLAAGLRAECHDFVIDCLDLNAAM